jgi:hypothetical protein
MEAISSNTLAHGDQHITGHQVTAKASHRGSKFHGYVVLYSYENFQVLEIVSVSPHSILMQGIG